MSDMTSGDAPETPDAPRRELVLERLLRAHEAWFDVSRDYEVAGRTFPGFAVYSEQGERYVLSRRAKLWEIASHEYVFFETVASLDEETLAREVAFVKRHGLAMVDPDEPNHMSSNVSLVLVADHVDEAARRQVRRVRFRKSFALGWKGWCDLRVAVVDLGAPAGSEVLTNAAGKVLRPMLRANVGTPRGDGPGTGVTT